MRRALLVNPGARAGGAERALADLAHRLPQHGFEPLAALPEHGPAESWLAQAGCPVEVAPTGAGIAGWLRRLVRDFAPAVVVSNKWDGHLLGGAAAFAEGLPAVWWQQDIAGRTPGELEAARVPAALVVCSSDYAVEAQRRLTPDAPLAKVHLGRPVEQIAARTSSGAAVRRRLGWSRARLVGMVGRIQRWKSQHRFLRAVAQFADSRPEVRFPIVGGAILGTEGAYPDELRGLAEELRLAERVHFAGHQEDVFPWLDALDVAVLATPGEPFGLVLVEAMALGTPVVATTPGGPAEIVEHGRSGLLVPHDDEKAMAGAILELLDDREMSAAMSQRARERASAFSAARMARELAARLDEVVEGFRPPPRGRAASCPSSWRAS